MRYLFTLSLLLFLVLTTSISAQKAEFPIVKNYGGIYSYDGSELPNSETKYKIVIDLKSLQQDKKQINPGLNNVARMMNLHGLGGVKPDDLEVVVVIHGSATDVITTHEGYQSRYGINNPNIPLISELESAGAKIYVCGQSLIGRKYAPEEVNPEVTVGLSMLTVYTTHVNKGFVPLIFD